MIVELASCHVLRIDRAGENHAHGKKYRRPRPPTTGPGPVPYSAEEAPGRRFKSGAIFCYNLRDYGITAIPLPAFSIFRFIARLGRRKSSYRKKCRFKGELADASGLLVSG